MISEDILKKYLAGIAGRIDQTLLKPEADLRQYEEFIEESDTYGFRALVVPPTLVLYASQVAKTPVATVIGFPNGYDLIDVKKAAIELAADHGAREVDVVANVINIKTGRFDAFENEIMELTEFAHEIGLIIKVIIETSYLTQNEIFEASKRVARASADYVKTCTGFGRRGATISDVIIMRKAVVGTATKVKASGGIRTAYDAAVMLMAGADVIGTSSGIAIVKESKDLLGV